jgi:hypothetical protein
MDLKVHSCIHNSPSLDPVLSQLSLLHILKPHLSNIYFNIGICFNTGGSHNFVSGSCIVLFHTRAK